MTPLLEKNERGEFVIHLEAIEGFLGYCEKMEQCLVEIKEILASNVLNDALLDIYDPERAPASEDICKAFLAIKNKLSKVI